jgi:cytochrome P450
MEISLSTLGAGSRTCIGRNTSLMEVTKIIPQLLKGFKGKLAYPEREWVAKNVGFVQQSGPDVLLKRQGKG